MKRTVILLFLFSISFTLFAQDLNHVVTDDKGNKKLLGQVNKEGLMQSPFVEWYNKQHDGYLLNDKIAHALKDSINDYSIKVFFGSWCGDSRRQLPRFYKMLEAADFPKDQLEVIAVDRTEKAYKQAPNGEEKGLNIHRVPTFIFYKNGNEVNRIVERPVETLERDVYNIIIEGKYRSNYRAVNYMHSLLSDTSMDSLKMKEQSLMSRLAEYAKGSRELNTYGYTLLRSNQSEKALYIFELNAKIFPYNDNVYDSLAEAYFKVENYSEALKNYYKVLSLNPESENAKKMIAKIEPLQNKS